LHQTKSKENTQQQTPWKRLKSTFLWANEIDDFCFFN